MILNSTTYQYKTSKLERELVEGCRLNDRQAQKKLYDLYCNAMYTSIYRILNNEEDANDVLQDAFIMVYKSIGSFRYESTLGAWIKSIVVRTTLHFSRKKIIVFEELDDNTFADNITVDIPDFIASEMLEKIILSLPESYRTPFLLIEVEGYSHAEVAKLLNITEASSKTRLFRAKKSLQKTINALCKNE